MTRKLIPFCAETINLNRPLQDATAIFTKHHGNTLLIKDDNDVIVGALTKDQLSKATEAGFSPQTSIKALLVNQQTGNPGDIITMTEITNNLFLELQTLHDVIEDSPASIVVTDENGVMLLANKAFSSHVGGIESANILGKTVYQLEEEKIFSPSVSAIALKEKKQVTIIQKTITGAEFLVTGIPLFDKNGRIYRVMSNAIDLRLYAQLTKYIGESGEKVNTLSAVPEEGKVTFNSKANKELISTAKMVAKSNSTVLITGESGSGKEVLARYIHQCSNRNLGKFVQINCGAIPESLFESELFGYESGAFSGATKGGKQGLFEYADKGTLFLDEIAEMPLNMQVKLLTSIQNKQITRVGGTKPIDIDVRVIAATNKDLKKEIEKGAFRLDLYYRLNVIPFHIPPLRERKEDIQPLIAFFIDKLTGQGQKRVQLSAEAYDVLMAYDWPGNIRELENVIENIVVTAKDSVVEKDGLPLYLYNSGSADSIIVKQITTLSAAFDEVERQLVTQAYKKYNSSYKLAKALGISQSAAHRKIQKYLPPKEQQE